MCRLDDVMKACIDKQCKKVLKREFVSLKYGFIHATKRYKFGTMFQDNKYSKMMESSHAVLMSEINVLASNNKRLKQENQSLCTSHHHSLISIQTKEDNLQLQALFSIAISFCKKQKVGASMFVNFGFAISKSLLSSEVKCIKKAKDFGPNCATGGRQAFFRTLQASFKCRLRLDFVLTLLLQWGQQYILLLLYPSNYRQ